MWRFSKSSNVVEISSTHIAKRIFATDLPTALRPPEAKDSQRAKFNQNLRTVLFDSISVYEGSR